MNMKCLSNMAILKIWNTHTSSSPETSQIEINNKDVSMFQCIISNISVVYGMDENQNNMTDFGYKALDIYDKGLFSNS